MATSLPTTEMIAKPVEPSEIADPPVDMKANLPAQGGLYTDTETYSREILGQTQFELYQLKATGTRIASKPWGPYPEQSKHIIDLDEDMQVGVIIKFDQSPLTRLLLCLGVNVSAYFHFEGFGQAAAEKDLKVTVTTKENQFKYWLGTVIKPQAKELGLTKGYYMFGATVEVGPVTKECGQYIFGYGYIGERRVQIADQPFIG